MEANNDKNKTKISQRIAEIKTKLCDGNNKKFAEMLGITEQYASNISNGTKYTGATMLLNSGVGMEVVSKVLGHSTTRITRQIYAKLLDDTIAEEMEKMM